MATVRQARASLVDRGKALLRGLLIRLALLLAGAAILAASIWTNLDAGGEIIAGLFRPDSPAAVVMSVVRLGVPAVGLWLVYRALR